MLLPSPVVVEVVGYSHILNVFSKQSKDRLMDGICTVREMGMTPHFLLIYKGGVVMNYNGKECGRRKFG